MRSLSPSARAILTSRQSLKRHERSRARLRKARTLSRHRDWAADRRARTRHLIELGGLVIKAGLIELVEDDRATLLGRFQDLADRLSGFGSDNERPADLKQRWRRRGLRTFDADAAAKAASEGTRKEVGAEAG